VAWLDRLAECEGFQWDDSNSEKIWERHRVARAECEEIFFNQPLFVGEDEKQATIEARFYALGRTDRGRYLFLAGTLRGALIRVISAQDMNRKERRIYQP